MKNKKSKIRLEPTQIKTIILSLVIAIVLTSFVIYLIQSIYPRPDYDESCGRVRKIALEEETQEMCEANGGEWIPQDIRCITTPCPQGYCDYYSDCQKQYESASNKYKLVVFIVSVISGLLAITIGIMLALPSVSSGLMLGGTFLTFYGTALYWTNLSNWLRTIILGLVLIILILLAYKKLRN